MVDRVRSPIKPGLHVYDCEVCSEPDSPQGWVPLRLVWQGGLDAACEPGKSGNAASQASIAGMGGELPRDDQHQMSRQHSQLSQLSIKSQQQQEELPTESPQQQESREGAIAALVTDENTTMPQPTVIFLHSTGVHGWQQLRL